MADHSKTSCAIIVTYNPDVPVLLRLLTRLGAGLGAGLGDSGCDFLLIDNGSSNIADFSPQLESLPNCIAIEKLDSNEGLASALNRGLCRLLRDDYAFAFLFDQDSLIEKDFCEHMMQAWSEAESIAPGRVAALGPRLEDPETGRRKAFKEFDRLLFRTDRKVSRSSSLYFTGFLISSGTLLSLANLTDIGLMKESYFIDNVDLEWCFRARAKGYVLYGTDRAVLYHRIGEASSNFLVRSGLMVQHSPLRSYYSTRNRLNLYRQNYAPLGWKLRDMLRFVLKSSCLLIFSPERRAYWKQIRRGIADSRALT